MQTSDHFTHFLHIMREILTFFYKQGSVYQRISTHVEMEPVCTFLPKVNMNHCLIVGSKIRAILLKQTCHQNILDMNLVNLWRTTETLK